MPAKRADSAPPHVATISVDDVDRRVRASLDLLRRSYHPIDDMRGGWYHDLSDAPPGPVATAVALLAFRLAGQTFDSAGPCWGFLRHRQITSRDRLRRGGWATNTTGDQPTVEATVSVVRLLGSGGYGFATFGPNAAAAIDFLANHQNSDGGWGSLLGNPSRTALTAQTVIALSALCPDHPAVAAGVRWLITSQTPMGGWGVTPTAPATVVHTAFALRALAAGPTGSSDSTIVAAYDWLWERLGAAADDEIHSHMETYNITANTSQRIRQWRETMHHHGLALATAALLHHPVTPPASVLSRAFGTLLRSQRPSGAWHNAPDSPAPAIWPTWYCLDALLELRRTLLLRPGDTILWLDHVVAVRRSSAGTKPLRALIRPRRRRGDLFRRHWAGILVATMASVSVSLALANVLDWPNALIGLLLPVLLLAVQEATAGWRRGQSRATSNRASQGGEGDNTGATAR